MADGLTGRSGRSVQCLVVLVSNLGTDIVTLLLLSSEGTSVGAAESKRKFVTPRSSAQVRYGGRFTK